MDDTFVELVLAQGESRVFEAKRVGAKNDRKLETILAFANTEGGVLALGIEDTRKAKGRDRVDGVDENRESVDELERLIQSRFTPRLGPPNAAQPQFIPVECTLRDGTRGHIVLVHVHKSPLVHSFVDNGTYQRFERSNRQLSAAEVTELSLRRGAVSYVGQRVDVAIELLDTPFFRGYAEARKLSRASPSALESIGLAKRIENRLQPTRAAVLLFAEDPAGLLDEKCTVRIFQYRGDQVEHAATTNLVRPPATIRGPVLAQIRDATDAIVHALATGVRVGALGFEVVQLYPLRVIREAVTNAVLHRDYYIANDIHVRIFDHRIEIESPGTFPGNVTQTNIGLVGSQPRNRQLVDHLREFPHPPNLDAGEGVPMMLEVMERSSLYPPLYQVRTEGRDAVVTILRNEAMPTVWKQVDQYLGEHGTIGNAEVRQLPRTDDPLKASKQLRAWLQSGLLELVDPAAGKRSRRYRRPGGEAVGLISVLGKQLRQS